MALVVTLSRNLSGTFVLIVVEAPVMVFGSAAFSQQGQDVPCVLGVLRKLRFGFARFRGLRGNIGT